VVVRPPLTRVAEPRQPALARAGAVRSSGSLARRRTHPELLRRRRSLETFDLQKAQALRQGVLFHARQNLTDIQTRQAVCVNGYLALDMLKETGREMINGCTRVATTGMSALAVAQTVVRTVVRAELRRSIFPRFKEPHARPKSAVRARPACSMPPPYCAAGCEVEFIAGAAAAVLDESAGLPGWLGIRAGECRTAHALCARIG
jgi:hypothetical protein